MRVSTLRGAPRTSFHVKRTANEVPWDPAFQYECSNGHFLQADAACCACPACVLGEPCGGDLRRVGKGSQGPRT